MSVDALLLDLGNVLVFHDNAALYRRLAARAGAAPGELDRALAGELSVRMNTGALQGEQLREEVCRLLRAEIPMPEFFELWSSHFTVHHAVLPRVEALAKRLPLVLVSNTNDLHWAWLRPRLPVLERFRAHVLSFEAGCAKPDLGIFRLALDAVGVEASRAAFFDDVAGYVDAATRLGIQGRVFTDAAAFDRQLAALGVI